MPYYFNRASSLTGLATLAGERGADLPGLMRGVGLSASLLNKPDERVDFVDVCTLFRRCADEWEMPDLGLRLAPYQSLEILGPIALVTRIEPTIRRAMQAITENLVIHSNAFVVVIEEQGDVASFIIDFHTTPPGVNIYAQLALGVAWNVLQQTNNGPVPLHEVTFRKHQGNLRIDGAKYFGCPLRSGAERNAMYFDRKVLDKALERSDLAYHPIIARYLKTSLHEVGTRTSDIVRDEIARQMEIGECTLESVAAALRTEPRSLQRRLKRDGATFRDLLDDWRRARALALVTQTRLPLSEISLAVGYSDQSIFSRAFQRWYGEAPLTYRHLEAQRLTAS